jgi:flagellar basal body rod protein FlgG
MVSGRTNVISSVAAHERVFGATADNVANANTNGDQRRQAVMREGAAGSVYTHIRRAVSPAPEDPPAPDETGAAKELSDVDRVEEVTGLVPTTIGYKANLIVLRAQDEMVGSLLDTLA